MGFDGVNVTVRPYPGHVDPENVAQELPPFVNTDPQARADLVRTITTNIADAESPNAERIVATASSRDLTHYWWGTYRYDLRKADLRPARGAEAARRVDRGAQREIQDDGGLPHLLDAGPRSAR